MDILLAVLGVVIVCILTAMFFDIRKQRDEVAAVKLAQDRRIIPDCFLEQEKLTKQIEKELDHRDALIYKDLDSGIKEFQRHLEKIDKLETAVTNNTNQTNRFVTIMEKNGFREWDGRDRRKNRG